MLVHLLLNPNIFPLTPSIIYCAAINILEQDYFHQKKKFITSQKADAQIIVYQQYYSSY